jgi:hypothetical protein
MAGATILVAAVLSVLNIRTEHGDRQRIRDLAEATTASAAAANGAALRFGNAAAVEEALARVLATSDGAALRAIAVNAQGETLVDPGQRTDAGDVSRWPIWRAPPRVGEAQAFARRVPARGPQFRRLRQRANAVGAVAIAWTPAFSRAAARSQQILNVAISAVVLAILLYGAGQPPAHARVPTGRRAGRGNRDPARAAATTAEVPFTDRGDEIGTIARNLSDLQSQLAEAPPAGWRHGPASNRRRNRWWNGWPWRCRPSQAAI